MSEHALEIVVGPDGGVDARDLARLGVRRGDHVRLVPIEKRTPTSLLGAFPREIGFTQEHLDDIRREMATGIGNDIVV